MRGLVTIGGKAWVAGQLAKLALFMNALKPIATHL
jgi:hypothetical protein